MKIIISPAKEIDLSQPQSQSGQPSWNPLTEEIMGALQALSESQVQKTLKVTDKQMPTQLEYINGFGKAPYYSALDLYNGLAYRWMDKEEFTEASLDYLKEHLVILSAMYGPISPETLIQPYRLDFNMSLKIDGQALKSLWQPIYNDYFQEGELILNLASLEFASLLDTSKFQWIDFRFIDSGKEHSTISKKARGKMVKFLAESQITSTDGLEDFHWDGYQLNSNLSTPNSLVYER